MPLCHGRRQNDAGSVEVPRAQCRARRALLASSGFFWKAEVCKQGAVRLVIHNVPAKVP